MGPILVFILIYVVPPTLLGGLLYLKFVWPRVVVRRSPTADITLIKARLDGEGHQVVDVSRAGGEIAYEGLGARGGSIARVFRIYSVTVQYPDGTRVLRKVGVACTLIGSPYLVIYEQGERRGLWTKYQASLP